MAKLVDGTTNTWKITTPVTLTFPNLLEAKSVMRNGKPTGEPKFSANFEFAPDHPDLAELKAGAAAAAKAKWPGRDLKELAFPFSNGSNLADKAAAKGKDREFSRGKAVLTARSKYQPKMSIWENGQEADLEGEAIKAHGRKFYSGVQVLGQVTFNAYDGVGDSGKPGVNAYLDRIVSGNRGKRLTGGASNAETFKDYVGSLSEIDPTVGAELDQEIPF